MVLLVVLGVIAFFLLRSVGVFGGNVTIPNVVGDPQSAAVQTLKSDNLTVGTSSFRTSPQTKGIVLSTSPAAGTSVSKNSAVNLVVSDGPTLPIVTVPPVKGEQLTAAISAIQDAGLTYRVKTWTSTQPVGTVINQSPAGGVKVRATVPVVLTVSNAESSVSVPSVLGQSPATAGATLRGRRTERRQPEATRARTSTSPGSCRRRARPRASASSPTRPSTSGISTGSCVSVPSVVGQFGQLGPGGHHERGPRGEPDDRRHVRRRGAAGQRLQPEPRRRHPGQQRHHGDDLGLPVGDHHDHHHDHTVVDHHHHHQPDDLDLARRSPAARALRAQAGGGLGGGPSCPRKLASSAGPDAVRTDSGWNCTPSTASVR